MATARPFDAVLCDLDGVLRFYDATEVNRLEAAAGLPEGTTEGIAFAPHNDRPLLLGRIDKAQWIDAIARDLADRGVPDDGARALAHAFAHTPSRTDPVVLGLLRRARERCTLVLVTNATVWLDQDLSRLGLADLADHVVNSSRVGVAKPDPGIYRIAAERAGLPAERCLFVDDRQENVDAARACGMTAVLFREPADLRAALAPLGLVADEPASPEPVPPGPDRLRGYLGGLARGALVDLLVEAAAADPDLGERLQAEAVRESLRETGRRARQAVDQCAGSADGGTDSGTDAVRAAQLAIEQLGAATERPGVTPSGLRALADEFADAFAELHLAACTAASAPGPAGTGPASPDPARPGPAAPVPTGFDPAATAAWLARRHLLPNRLPGTAVPRGIAAYAGLLGAAGLDAYAAALGSGERPPAARRLEELHTLRGDTDALVAVLAADLGHPSRHLRIAELLADADRLPEAVEWAERGRDAVTAGLGREDRLAAFLAAHYGAVGRRADAVALLRAEFLTRPDPAGYRALLDAAGPDGAAEQRAWALAELNGRAARTPARSWQNPAAPLIEVLVATGDLDAAWSAADRYDIPHPARLRLARLRAEDQPAEAVPVYRRELDAQIELMTRESYRAAIALVLELRELYRRAGVPEEFDPLLAQLRETHRAKGSLLAELAAEGL